MPPTSTQEKWRAARSRDGEGERYAGDIVPSFSAYAYFRIGTASPGAFRKCYRVASVIATTTLAAVDPSSSVIFVINHRSNMDTCW
jgi:glycerol-3-phosphate O-acyltransferase